MKKPILERVIYALALIALFFIFFHKLGSTALLSYDEAWYAEITRNLVKSKNPFELQFNGERFNDHPPFGYILMSVPTGIFGSNEFTVRSISALMGVGSIALIFLIGKNMSDTQTGLMASAILLSSLWFMLRARSGNLDVHIVFWSLLTFFMFQKTEQVKEKKKRLQKYLLLASASFAALVLTKALVGFGLLPLIAYRLWLLKSHFERRSIILAGAVWLGIVTPWYLVNQISDPTFFEHHFLTIGTRGQENSFSFAALKQNLLYLQIGIGRWQKAALIGLAASFHLAFSAVKPVVTVATRSILLYFLGFGALFFFSTKTEVWHLIPVYPALALAIAYAIDAEARVSFSIKAFKKILTAIVVGVGIFQFFQMSNLIYIEQSQPTAEKDISLVAGESARSTRKELHLMETFYPASVYYSQTRVVPLHWQGDAYQALQKNIDEDKSITVINKSTQESLIRDQVHFEVIYENNNYLLIE